MGDLATESILKMRRTRDFGRRLPALEGLFAESRGDRFTRNRSAGSDTRTRPTLADMINLPDWILCEDQMVDDIAIVTALLHFRHAIDQLLCGIKLRAICETIGEANYDLACDAAIPANEWLADSDTALPPPEQLKSAGHTMLERALPVAMAATHPSACGDEAMRQLSNIATSLVMTRHYASLEQAA